MNCINCRAEIRPHEKIAERLMCGGCHLQHTLEGEALGWEVAASRVPSGFVPYASIEPYRNPDGTPFTRVLVGSLIRAGAIVGLRDMEAVCEELGREAMDIAVESVLDGAPNAGATAEA